MEEISGASKMINTRSVLDDFAYSIISEFCSRFISNFPEIQRKRISELANAITEEYDMGTITIRKKPSPRQKVNTNSSRSDKQKIMERTKSISKSNLEWFECSDLKGIDKEYKHLIYCLCSSLGLSKDNNTVVIGSNDEDDNVEVYRMMNKNFETKKFTRVQASIMRKYGLIVDEENID
jgi:hypothetical protein